MNEWNVTSGSQNDYQEFGKAQLDVYNAASFGWCYWTLKNDREHWDFEWNIRNNYLQLGKHYRFGGTLFADIFLLFEKNLMHLFVFAGNSPSKQNLNALGLLGLGLACTWFCLLPFL